MSDTDDSPLAVLKATHSKEKKDLQAKVTALKRNIPNTDKKKKKEVTSQIEQLEKELKEKHAKELEELEAKLVNLNIGNSSDDQIEHGEPSAENDSKGHKVSKKQKRLEKKVAETKRKEEAAAEDEAAAATSRAKMETESIMEALGKKNLKVYDIAPDGDCLYNAIAHQMSEKSTKIFDGANIRSMAADYMKSHHDDFLPFLTDSEGESLTNDGFEKYLKSVEASSANGGVWGGGAEIRAISSSSNQRIEIIQPNGQVTVFGEDIKSKDPIVITYHRHAYALGEHYNSTVKAGTN